MLESTILIMTVILATLCLSVMAIIIIVHEFQTVVEDAETFSLFGYLDSHLWIVYATFTVILAGIITFKLVERHLQYAALKKVLRELKMQIQTYDFEVDCEYEKYEVPIVYLTCGEYKVILQIYQPYTGFLEVFDVRKPRKGINIFNWESLGKAKKPNIKYFMRIRTLRDIEGDRKYWKNLGNGYAADIYIDSKDCIELDRLYLKAKLSA